MPFTIPFERSKVSTRDTFSKYKNKFETEWFILQKRKKMFRSEYNPTYRIITQHRPFFEIAQSFDLDEMLRNEWDYICNHLPQLVPRHLPSKARHSWFIAHFTQLALETSEMNESSKYALRQQDEEVDPSLEAALRTVTDGESGLDADYHPASPAPNMNGTTATLHKGTSTDDFAPFASYQNRYARQSTTYRQALLASRQNQGGFGGDEILRFRLSRVEEALAEMKAKQGVSGTLQDEKKYDKPMYLKGNSVAILVIALTNVQWMLARDCSKPVFLAFLVAFNLLVFAVIGRGDPVSLGVVFGGDSQLFHRNKAPTQQKEQLPKQRGRAASAIVQSGPDNMLAGRNHPIATPVSNRSKSAASDDDTDRKAALLSSPPPTSTSTSSSLPVLFPPEQGLGFVPGSTVPQDLKSKNANQEPSPGTWSHVATVQKVRNGPNYKSTGAKTLSGPPLYHPVAFDIFRSESREETMNLGQYMNLDALLAKSQDWAAFGINLRLDYNALPKGVPRFLIVQFQVPNYAPSNPIWGSPKTDGEGWSVVFTFHIKEETYKALVEKKEQSPALTLFQRWCAVDITTDDQNAITEMRKRFKAIPRCVFWEELDELGWTVRSSINKANAKPFMTGPRCHNIYRGRDYIEVDCNAHNFNYVALQGLWQASEYLKILTMDAAFLIQGESDEELPEQTLGTLRWAKVDLDNLKSFKQLLTAGGPKAKGKRK